MVLYLFIAFYLLLAGVCFHFGWRQHRPGHRARGGFYLCVAVFLPLLWSYHEAREGAAPRLYAIGVTPHPAIVGPSGLAVGLDSSPRTWLFDLREPGIAALAFYRDPSHVAGWRLGHDAGDMLTFRRDGDRLLIAGGDRPTLTYMLYRDDAPGRPANARRRE